MNMEKNINSPSGCAGASESGQHLLQGMLEIKGPAILAKEMNALAGNAAQRAATWEVLETAVPCQPAKGTTDAPCTELQTQQLQDAKGHQALRSGFP